jgi:streptogramin lyase
MKNRQWVMATAVLVWGVAAANARMDAYTPALAVRTGSAGSAFLAVSVTGAGFGTAGPGLSVQVEGVRPVGPVALSIPSTDARVFAWKDVQIVLKLPADLARARITVAGPTGRSRRVSARYYTHDSFDTSAVGGPYGFPTHIAIDPAGRVWVNPEYKRNYYFFDPDRAEVLPALFPQAMMPRPFEFCIDACVHSLFPSGGEAVAVDDKGRVWMPESGGAGGDDGPRNHGRVIMYDPPNATVRLYNLPGDRNGILGIAWDGPRGRIWLSQTNSLAYGSGSTLISFDPERVPFETFAWATGSPPPNVTSTFDFSTTATCETIVPTEPGACSNAPEHLCVSVEDCVLAELLCKPGTHDYGDCYHEYPLDIYQPAHVTVHPDGHVWFTEYAAGVGGRLGRLDPTTGVVEMFPLTFPPFTPWEFPLNLLPVAVIAPWDIKVAPDGSIVATEFAANRIARFPARFMTDTAQCQRLSAPGLDPKACQASYDPLTGMISTADPRCTNPCIQERLVPGSWVSDSRYPPLTHLAAGRLLGVAPDRQGYLWIDQGYLDRRGRFYLWPPLLAMDPTPTSPSAASQLFSGIGGSVAVDPRTGDIWGADYFGRRLNRLRLAH